MQINFNNLITYFIDNFRDLKKQSEVIEQIREMLSQEMMWNHELLKEISYLRKKHRQEDLEKVIDKFELDVFNILKETGIPLSKIISGDYQPDVTLKYQHLLKKHSTKTRLILNTYHRLKVFKLRIEIQNERDTRSSNYLNELLRESIRLLEG